MIPYYVTPNTQNANNTTRNMARAFDKEDLGLALQYLSFATAVERTRASVLG